MPEIILPKAKLGVVHRLGEIILADLKNGIAVFVRDDQIVQRVYRDGQVMSEVAFGEKQMTQMAEFFAAAST